MKEASMLLDQNYNSIPVFPIHKNTFVGIATDKSVVINDNRYGLIHSDEGEDGDFNTITFKFSDSSDVVLDKIIAGQDFGILRDAVSITSTKQIVMS